MAPNAPSPDRGKCTDWKAWIDAMPLGRRLHVQGTCVYPTAGWTITLEKAVPPGINPAVLILNRRSKSPQGQAAEQITTYTPMYEEKLQPGQDYKQVTVMPDNVTLDVKIIH